MDTQNIARMRQAFDHEKQKIAKELARLYGEIHEETLGKPLRSIAFTISDLEVEKINTYIQTLKWDLKKVAVQEAASCGVADHLTEMLWLRVMKAVELPQVQLCEVKTAEPAVKKSSKKPSDSDKARKSELLNKRNKALAVLGTGVVLDAACCMLVVPGMTAKAVYTAGTALMIAGGAGAVYYQHEASSVNHVYTEERRNEEKEERINEMLTQICESQCRLNGDIICGWVDRVMNELIEECGRLA